MSSKTVVDAGSAKQRKPGRATNKPAPGTMPKRVVSYVLGLNILAAGIVLNTRSGLGAAYAFSNISSLSFGTATALIYLVLVVLELVLLRKPEPAVLLQIPFSFAFGIVVDVYDALFPRWSLSLAGQFVLLAVAILCTATGVTLSVRANFVVAPPDGTVQTISRVSGRDYGLVKNVFDLTMMGVTVVMCLSTGSPFYGLGIGTVLSALLNGRIIRLLEMALDRHTALGQH
ncbi:YczE/YyaS/YitT family protein [Tractidigestivibacter sp.]|uniref:YczE/YyaS/YitT family protein n=1 Tax=Tractidigestivibacter sp. TaxID=2847320 RepID=UPI003FD89750